MAGWKPVAGVQKKTHTSGDPPSGHHSYVFSYNCEIKTEKLWPSEGSSNDSWKSFGYDVDNEVAILTNSVAT
jgi:hypothetical protein